MLCWVDMAHQCCHRVTNLSWLAQDFPYFSNVSWPHRSLIVLSKLGQLVTLALVLCWAHVSLSLRPQSWGRPWRGFRQRLSAEPMVAVIATIQGRYISGSPTREKGCYTPCPGGPGSYFISPVSGPPTGFENKLGLWRYSDLDLNSSWAAHWAIQPLKPPLFFFLVGFL